MLIHHVGRKIILKNFVCVQRSSFTEQSISQLPLQRVVARPLAVGTDSKNSGSRALAIGRETELGLFPPSVAQPIFKHGEKF